MPQEQQYPMRDARNSRHVVWRRSSDLQTIEWCMLAEGPNEKVLEGLILGAVADLPLRIEYRVVCHLNWQTSVVDVRQQYGRKETLLALVRDDAGAWICDGQPMPAFEGCADVDLSFSPSTNTLPIRRLGLAIGASETIDAAWVLFPDLEIRVSRQTYTRLSDQSYRYASGDFAAELGVDAAGLVTDYWEWQRIAVMA
jgi:uncharacterized protein